MTGCTADSLTARTALYLSGPIVISIDSDFNVQEEMQIARAFETWQMVSNGAIRFMPYWNQPKPNTFWKVDEPSYDSGIFMWQIDKKSSQLDNDLRAAYNNYDGLFIRGTRSAYILIFVHEGEDIYTTDFYQVVLHELGHLLGLDHSLSKNSVMFYRVHKSCVNKKDAVELCNIYGCKPSPEPNCD